LFNFNPLKKNFSYNKSERLKRRKILTNIFSAGQQLHQYPLKAFWLFHSIEVPHPLQTGVSVSKRLFKKAVDRNRMKRLMREAYRMHKSTLESNLRPGSNFSLFILYTGKEKISQDEMNEKMQALLLKIQKLMP